MAADPDLSSRMSSWIRREPIVAPAPILAVAGVLHLATAPPGSEVYSVYRWAQGLSIVFLVGPVAAACAAYVVGRLKNADILTHRWARGRLIIAHALGATAAVSLVLTMGLGLYQAGFSLPNFRLLIVTVMALLQMLAWGVMAALLFPTLLAIPFALVGGYIWMVFPMTMEPLWLRHVNGYWPTCCAIDQEPSLSAVLGVSAVAVGAWVAVYGLVHRASRQRLVISGATSLLFLLCGFFSVSQLGPDPVEQRASDLSCRALASGGELCLFAEHEEYRDGAQELLADLSDQWNGIVPVGQVRYSESSYDVNALHVTFAPKSPEEDIGMLAQAHMPPFPQCGDRPYENAEFRDVAFEGLMSLAGISSANPDSRVEHMRTLDQMGKQQWFGELFDRATCCSTHCD